jgi:hypothetical protein
MSDRMRLGRGLGMEDELDDARPIAQVDEDQAAVVTTAVNPAGDASGRAGAGAGQLGGPGVTEGVAARSLQGGSFGGSWVGVR